jgi:hypothetical protein
MNKNSTEVRVVKIFTYETSFISIIFKDSYFTSQSTHHNAVKTKTHLVLCRKFIFSLSKSDVCVRTVCGAKLRWYAIVAAVLESLTF